MFIQRKKIEHKERRKEGKRKHKEKSGTSILAGDILLP
jgi:hypothetical protein